MKYSRSLFIKPVIQFLLCAQVLISSSWCLDMYHWIRLHFPCPLYSVRALMSSVILPGTALILKFTTCDSIALTSAWVSSLPKLTPIYNHSHLRLSIKRSRSQPVTSLLISTLQVTQDTREARWLTGIEERSRRLRSKL